VVRERRLYDLRGKTVLISGGSRGLGLVLGRAFGREGARVVLLARGADDLERAQLQLETGGVTALAIPCDITDPEAVARAVAQTETRFGGVDVLVNNAGVIQVGPASLMTAEDYQLAMDVHFWASYRLIEAVLPGMRRRGHGRIVNISSLGGKVPVPHLLPYVASKFALAGYSAGLRAELAGEGVLVTTVIPGLMRTGSPRHALFKGRHQAEFGWFSILDSLPGLTVSAEHAAQAIVAACRRGQSEVMISVPAQVAARVTGLVPGLVNELLALTARVLPGPGDAGTEAKAGRDSESWVTRSFLTVLTQRAAARNNE